MSVFRRTLVCSEVKTRLTSSRYHFSAEGAVDEEKQHRLRTLIDRYLSEHRSPLRRYRIVRVRFDIITVTAGPLPFTYRVQLWQGAFE